VADDEDKQVSSSGTDTGLAGRDGQVADDELALVAAAQRRPADFDLLYQRYVGPVYCYVRARIGSHHDAEDLTAQVFCQALAALPRYRVTGQPFAAWLFRIAHNCVVSHLRRRATAPLNVSLDVNGASPSHEDVVVQRELVRRVGVAVRQLDATRQTVLALYYGAGLRVPEIARVLDRSEASTYKLLERTVAALRRVLRDEESDHKEHGHGGTGDD
jgi:RNA polymerase sigma-70 factor (ECF subfamily)